MGGSNTAGDGGTVTDRDFHQRRERAIGNSCSCMAFSLERLRELFAEREPIVDSWTVDGVLVMGDPLRRIVGEAATPKAARRRAL